jgi:hemerythrin superfamily protein
MTTDIFDSLTADHREVEDLLDRARRDGDPVLVRQACDALTRHAEIEESVLYPELRRIVDGGDDMANDAIDEHAAMRTLVAQIYEAPPADLTPVLDALQSNVLDHVKIEENEIFPALRACGADAAALGRRLDAARAEPASRRPGEVA